MTARKPSRSLNLRILVVLACTLFVVSLEYVYAHMDARLFSFLGLRYLDIGTGWRFLGLGMAVLPSLWMPVVLRRPSMVAYWILYLTVIVPVMWIPFHTLDSQPEGYLLFSGVLLLCFYLLGFAFRLPRWRIPRPDIPQDVFVMATLSLVTVMTLAVWSTNGFHLDLSFKSIYDRRRAAGEAIPMGSFLSYVKGNLGSALQPFAFAVGIARRSWIMVGVSLLAGIVGFSVDGSKTSALIPLFLLGLYPLMTKFRSRFGIAVPLMGAAFVILAMILKDLTKDPRIPVVTTWRMFDVKGLLSGYYWEYFSSHPKMLLSDGILRVFFDNPYKYAAPEQIGYVYFGSSQTNSNAHVWASAYGDFGYFGMFLVTGLLGLIFRAIDSMAVNRGFLIPAFLASFLGMKLSDVALDTSILSHGTLAILLLIYFLPPLKAEVQDEPLSLTRPVRA
ncbi:MAG: hypothetical protein JSS66_12295 [Armatimonadetes bacterium]|nr:hypothetical protein [Armatimonadota bacterium]